MYSSGLMVAGFSGHLADPYCADCYVCGRHTGEQNRPCCVYIYLCMVCGSPHSHHTGYIVWELSSLKKNKFYSNQMKYV